MRKEIQEQKRKARKKKATKRFIDGIIYLFIIFFVMVIFISAVLLYKTIKEPSKVSSFLGYKPLTVLSGSMEPALKPGDMIIVKEIEADKLDKGDIVTFESRDNNIVTHRITKVLKKDGNYFFSTKGDANNSEDLDEIAGDKLIGKEIFKIPYAGYISEFARSKYGFLLFIIFPVAILIAGEIKSIVSEVKKDKKKENKTEEAM